MPDEELGRRALLVGAGCAALTLLGACGTGTGSGDEPGEQPDGVLAKAAQVPVGGGIVTAGGVVVLQLQAGKFTAFDATCPHQAFKVQAPNTEGLITCLGHNSHFRVADGSVVDGPATRGLTSIAVKLSGEDVVRD